MIRRECAPEFLGKFVRVKGIAFLSSTCQEVARAALRPLGCKHLHIAGNNIYHCALDTVFVGVLALRQAALDVDLRALVQIGIAGLGELAPGHDVEPIGLLMSLASA